MKSDRKDPPSLSFTEWLHDSALWILLLLIAVFALSLLFLAGLYILTSIL